MPRLARTEYTYDSSWFNPVQMQPRAALAAGFGNWAKWASCHLASFSRLITEYATSFVVVRLHLEYLRPFRFLDGDRVVVSTGVRLDEPGEHIVTTSTFTDGAQPLLRVDAHARCVRLQSGSGFAARPGTVPAELAARFTTAERGATTPGRTLHDRLETLARSHPATASGSYHTTVHRNACEVADQWSFVDVPAHLAASRETLAAEHGATVSHLRRGITHGLRSVEVELVRPYFLLDRATVTTTAHVVDDTVLFAHRLTGRDDRLHGLALETMAPA